jgi:hypothetical protein
VVLVIIAQFPAQVHDLSHKLKIILRMFLFERLVRITKEFVHNEERNAKAFPVDGQEALFEHKNTMYPDFSSFFYTAR